MKGIKKIALTALMMFAGFVNVNAQDVDTTYIKLDANMEPINYIGLTADELKGKIGDLETILETENFQLYASGDYTFKVENGMVISQSIQIADDENTKVVYNQILNALSKSRSIKDTHNTGGNYYQYANFQIQFDDFDGYQKLSFQVIPVEENLAEN